MLTTVEGVFKDGKVELDEIPDVTGDIGVRVTFLENEPANGIEKPEKGKMIRRGMFPQLQVLTDEDFKAAEFHGDSDDGLNWSG